MMASARVMLPGMVASMLFAAPALAGHDAAPPPRKAAAASQAAPHRARVFAVRARRFRHDSRVGLGGIPFVQEAARWSAPHDVGDPGADGARADALGAAPPQVGMASWYGGSRWHGNMTSGGERFDQDALTAAHATLPLGTLVRVSTLNGSGSVVVRITDRPGTRRRIIDLSRGAARELGILERGIAMVSLQPL